MAPPWIASAALAVLSACGGGSSPAEQREEASKMTTSWAATARMTAEAWLDGAVPTVYAAQTLRQTSQELYHQEQSSKWQSLPAADRTAVLDRFHRVAATADAMSAAVGQMQRAAVTEGLRQLPAPPP